MCVRVKSINSTNMAVAMVLPFIYLPFKGICVILVQKNVNFQIVPNYFANDF
jgi:hypothetical protein